MACNNKNLELAVVPSESHLSSSLHDGSSSRFQLPEGWIVEERPRRSKPGFVDRVLLFLTHQPFFIHSCMHV